jgi:hypothetical protein
MNRSTSGKPALRQALTWGMVCVVSCLLLLVELAAPHTARADGGGFPTSTPTVTPVPTDTPLPTDTQPPPTSYPAIATQAQEPIFILPTPTPAPARGSSLALLCLPFVLGIVLVVIVVATVVARRQR